MILMPHIFDIIANESVPYKRNDLELVFFLVIVVAQRALLSSDNSYLFMDSVYIII